MSDWWNAPLPLTFTPRGLIIAVAIYCALALAWGFVAALIRDIRGRR